MVALCRRKAVRRTLGVGAIAVAYSRIGEHPEIRVAELDGYRLAVNVTEHLGLGPYFFGDSGTLWPTASLIPPGGTCVESGFSSTSTLPLAGTSSSRSWRRQARR